MAEQCSTCKQWVFGKGHVCPPAFECRFAKNGPIYADEEWETVYAYNAEVAAEKYCEHYDANGGEYVIVTLGERNPPTVEVRRQGEDQQILTCRVVGETEPVYRGELIEAQ